MKIAFLAAYFYPFSSGMENNCYYLARELAKNNEVHIYTADRKDGLTAESEEILEGINIHRFKVFRYKYYFYFSFSMFFDIMKEDFDVIHIHGFGFFIHDLVIFWKNFFSRTKFVCTPHGPFMALEDYSFFHRILKFFYMPFLKIVISFYDKVIQVNEYQYYAWMKKDYGIRKSQVFYLPNGISYTDFKKTDYSIFEKKYSLKNKFVISYLGRFNKYKGIDQVIKIFPEVLKKHKNAIFLIMGKDAGYLNELKILVSRLNIEKNILFIENINDDEKFKALEKSEIFILPSEWEAFGIVIIEAMAHNNAIISTKTEGGKFLVGKENGILYDYKDLERLKFSMINLIEDNKSRKNMQKNNLIKSREFIWENIAVDLEKLYKELLK